MKTEQQMVRDWMIKFGQETHNNNPTIPSLEVRKLRAKLILEEALETIAGLGLESILDLEHSGSGEVKIDGIIFMEPPESIGANIEEIADGIADSLVVLLGTAVACGIDIKPVFDEVMRSNNSKLWMEEDLENKFPKGISQAKENNHYPTLVEEQPEGCTAIFLVKNKDGKVIKSPSYSPANITPLLK